MQFTQVAYGGCWKCPQAWQRCNASTPCLAASQNGFVHSFGTGIGLVTLLQSLIVVTLSHRSRLALDAARTPDIPADESIPAAGMRQAPFRTVEFRAPQGRLKCG
jgi:hypothetical protein